VEGPDGFRIAHRTQVAEISRDLTELAGQACSEYHRYPDGLVLFIGTMFAPTADRGAPAAASPTRAATTGLDRLARDRALVNEVVACDAAEPWVLRDGRLDGEPRPARGCCALDRLGGGALAAERESALTSTKATRLRR
jgi:fumarylacetoacetate (FAA) hydrolase family protein